MVEFKNATQSSIKSEACQKTEEPSSLAPTFSYASAASAHTFDQSKPHPKPQRRKKLGRPKVHWSKSASRARKKEPRFLRRDQVRKAFELDASAAQCGLRLETFVSLRWSLTAQQEDNIPKRWTRFLSSLGRWCRARGLTLAYIWVHENPPRSYPAFNTHMLVNIPRRLIPDLVEFLVKILQATDPKAVDVRPRTSGRYTSEVRLKYMLKGTDWATAKKYGLILPGNRWKGLQGFIPFKRIGFSRSLQSTTRLRVG